MTSPFLIDGTPVNEPTIYNRLLAPLNKQIALLRADDTGWLPLTLAGAWVWYGVGYPTPAYRLRAGRVYLQGLVKLGALASTITTLPADFRPVSGNHVFCVSAGAGEARIDVQTSGVVFLNNYMNGGTNGNVDLGGCTFFVDA